MKAAKNFEYYIGANLLTPYFDYVGYENELFYKFNFKLKANVKLSFPLKETLGIDYLGTLKIEDKEYTVTDLESLVNLLKLNKKYPKICNPFKGIFACKKTLIAFAKEIDYVLKGEISIDRSLLYSNTYLYYFLEICYYITDPKPIFIQKLCYLCNGFYIEDYGIDKNRIYKQLEILYKYIGAYLKKNFNIEL